MLGQYMERLTSWDGRIVENFKECFNCSFNVLMDYKMGPRFMIIISLEYSRVKLMGLLFSPPFSSIKIQFTHGKIYPFIVQL